MRTVILILIITMTSAVCEARSSGSYSGGSSYSRSSAYSYRGHHSSGRQHTRAYYYGGDRTPSGYTGRQPGLMNIDHAYEQQPPGPNITKHSLYRGIDKNGALIFSNLP